MYLMRGAFRYSDPALLQRRFVREQGAAGHIDRGMKTKSRES